jgi:hypothetical protein
MDDPNHKELTALYALWGDLGAGRLPARSAFTHARLRPWMGNLAILRLVPPHGRLYVDLVGTNIVQVDGVDSTGKYLDEIAPPHAVDILLAPYRELLETGRPTYHRFTPPNRPSTSVHRLLLPLADDGATIDRILSGVYAEKGLVKGRETVFDHMAAPANRRKGPPEPA